MRRHISCDRGLAYRRDRAWIAMAVAPLVLSAVLVGNAGAAELSGGHPGGEGSRIQLPRMDATSRHIIFDHHAEPLIDVETMTVDGRSLPGADGGCEFGIPALHIDGVGVREARPTTVDFVTCTATWEIGTPVKAEGSEVATGDTGTGPATDAQPRSAEAPATEVLAVASSKTASAKVLWHDIVHITTSRLQSNISWSYDGSRITTSSGSYSWYKATATGWFGPYNLSSIISRPSSNMHQVRTSGHFTNPGIFCTAVTVTSYIDDIRVRGYANGSFNGFVDSTWTTESPSWLAWKCPNLHPHVSVQSPA